MDSANADQRAWHGLRRGVALVVAVSMFTFAPAAVRVDAHHLAGAEGIPPATGINPPSELTATTVSDGRIDLHWSDNSDNEGEFRIERDIDAGFGSPVVQSAAADSTSFADAGLSPGTTYYYRVRASNATDSSGCSNSVSATTMASLPFSGPPQPPPTGIDSTSTRRLHALEDVYPTAVLRDRPVGYWRLDEASGASALDASGPNPGIYRNGPELGRPSLLPADPGGHSVRFGGGGERVEVPGSASLEARGRLSVEAWIELREMPGRRAIALVAGKPGAFALKIEGGRLVFAIGGHPGERGRLRAPAGWVAVDEAHQVVATYDGNSARLFVDGARVAGAQLSVSLPVVTRPFEIGSLSQKGGQFRGAIDEVALYTRPLTPAQVSDHYRAGAWPRLSS